MKETHILKDGGHTGARKSLMFKEINRNKK
jgi:hypothetical protein